jgi:hypothetical protein
MITEKPTIHLFTNSKPPLFMRDVTFRNKPTFIMWVKLVGGYGVEIKDVERGEYQTIEYKR